MERILSLQNAKIKRAASLRQKKYRDLHQSFLIEEWHLVEEAYRAGCLEQLFVLEGNANPLPDFEAVYEVSANVMHKLSQTVSDSHLIGVCRMPNCKMPQNHCILLDRIQDPGNVGTIIRTAYAMGYQGCILSDGCADPYNEKTIRSTQGALFHLPIVRMDLQAAIAALRKQGDVVYGTALEHALAMEQIEGTKSVSLVFGNEGKGIDPALLVLCDGAISIWMERFESLNVAVACGIAAHWFRDRK